MTVLESSLRSSRKGSPQIPVIQPDPRYFVLDLSPEHRPELKKMKPRYLFVAESPHIQEVEPEKEALRRPLCGAAGKQWWSKMVKVLGGSLTRSGDSDLDLSAQSLMAFCLEHKLVVMNAVQYPLDPKVAQRFPAADPAKNLGFNKVSGPYSFKKRKDSVEVLAALESLKNRLNHPSVRHLPIYSLGNDSEWLVLRALGVSEAETRYAGKIPHPAAWWRRGGWFGEVAEEKLKALFSA